MALGSRTHACPPVLAVRSLWLVAFTALGPGCFDPTETDDDPTEVATEGATDGATDDAAESTAAAQDEAGAETTGATGDSGGDPADPAAACAEYCGLVTDHCEGELSQYAGTAVCEATCAQMPLGTPEDSLGNTVGCRTFHALLAAESPEPHCHHAGPTGDGTCGANCENFCSMTLSTCTGDLAPYPDADTCVAACQGFAAEPVYFADAPDADTFACRMRHLTLAAAQPESHCGHLGEASPVCVD